MNEDKVMFFTYWGFVVTHTVLFVVLNLVIKGE